MADFDEITYEDDSDENGAFVDESIIRNVPDPIFIRGSGHLTVFGLSHRFSTEFPPVLAAKLAPEEYKATVERINSILRKTMPLNVKWLICGCLCCCCTLGCSFMPAVQISKRSRHMLKKALEWENRRLYYKLGLNWSLCKVKCESGNMEEYVLKIEFVPKLKIQEPD